MVGIVSVRISELLTSSVRLVRALLTINFGLDLDSIKLCSTVNR
jgi:hypothetical protein